MNATKIFSSRDSATQALRKLGVDKTDYVKYIEKTADGKFECFIGDAEQDLGKAPTETTEAEAPSTKKSKPAAATKQPADKVFQEHVEAYDYLVDNNVPEDKIHAFIITRKIGGAKTFVVDSGKLQQFLGNTHVPATKGKEPKVKKLKALKDPKEPKTPRRSSYQLQVNMITEGHDDLAVLNAIVKEFDLDILKVKAHPAWTRWDMCRKGLLEEGSKAADRKAQNATLKAYFKAR